MSDPDDRRAEEQAQIDAEFTALIARFHDGEEEVDRGSGHDERGRTSTVPGLPSPPNTTRSLRDDRSTADPNTGYGAPQPGDAPQPDDGEEDPDAGGWRRHTPPEDDALDDEGPEIPPLPPYRPSPMALVGCGLLALAAVLSCCLLIGVRLPYWAGWLALGSLLGGVAVLVSRLPRTRDPDDGDGARL